MHFVQTSKKSALPKSLIHTAIDEIAAASNEAIDQIETSLPSGYPEEIHASVKLAMTARLRSLALPDAA